MPGEHPTSPADAVRAYHQRSKHRFQAYAPGPQTLDWDAQPEPFRHFDGAEAVALPAPTACADIPALAAALARPFADLTTQDLPPLAPTLPALGLLLHLALGITAWKSWGPDRWAVRANPSSGNLHPVEAYVIVYGFDGLADGLYHYRPDDHSLERRAGFAATTAGPRLYIGLSSAMWREAWKYGERAFRYCQLDSGHAIAALRYAAAALGWKLAEQPQAGNATLARLLGLDRAEDFPAPRHAETEREEAEVLLGVGLDGAPPAPADPAALLRDAAGASWYGTASTLDAHPMYRWPAIEEVAAASRRGDGPELARPELPAPPASLAPHDYGHSAAAILLQRRSAQRFDARHVMPRRDFITLLDALLPRPQAPWDALAGPARIALLLFVHRVEGMEPGLYLLGRDPRLLALLEQRLDRRFAQEVVAGMPPCLDLRLLTTAPPAELQRAARSLHCHQDIAANACFALGMLAEFGAVVTRAPADYRALYREAGVVGQVLYLEAEARGLRGTGIGCFFDDPVHELLGLADDTYQTVYHFTVGLPLEDPRIASTPTFYPERTS